MKLAFQLAYKNLVGAGLRTWLNVAVLAFAFIIIIYMNGLMDGWNQQARQDSIAWEYGNGQLLHENYDPFDPFSIQDAHGVLPATEAENLTPILIRQASIYPEGRMLSVLLKGIDTKQTTLELPTNVLEKSDADIPAIIGEGMAKTAKLKEGDQVLLRWRDKNGTFDAANLTIVQIFDTDVPTVDKGQIWIPIKRLWVMTELPQHATMYVANEAYQNSKNTSWKFSSQEDLLATITQLIATKKASSYFMYILLLGIALLAIFDTQVLSVFRRQREIGTYVALGMTRRQVVGLFTVEGSMYSFFAMIVGLIVGTPLLWYAAKTGLSVPEANQDMGIAISDTMYPVFGLGLVASTILLVVISATIVSFLPARKIANMNTVDALKGKMQ